MSKRAARVMRKDGVLAPLVRGFSFPANHGCLVADPDWDLGGLVPVGPDDNLRARQARPDGPVNCGGAVLF
jgi:hypothetical protein